MQGLGATGAQQSKDCSFAAGTVAGAPLRVSWFLVIFFVYQLIDALKARGVPVWVMVAQVTGNEIILLLTVLVHEMGHGTMARRCGGTIAQVLLWPFGGICFSTRAQGRDSRQKLVDDLWIVGAGPATHFPMGAAWLALLVFFASVYEDVALPPSWHTVVPFMPDMLRPCLGDRSYCFQSYTSLLCYQFLSQAVRTNVMLFMFNVFFPMYPMDGAKLIVCSLQLFCNASARCAAKVLVYTSGPLAILFIGYALKGMHGGGMQPGIMLYMGIMCLSEAYKIYKLLQEERLHTHPLFELARSQTRTVADSSGTMQRLNVSDRDDEETGRAPQVPRSNIRPFAGAGRTLNSAQELSEVEAVGFQALPGDAETAAAAAGTSGLANAREARLARLERDAAEKSKSVRQLEDERLERERLERDLPREGR